MASRRKPIAVTLDAQVESFMDAVENLLESTVVAESTQYDNVERRLRELRKAWLAETTARAMLKQ